MSRDDDRIRRDLRAAVSPASVPPGLAERAFRVAMAAAAAPFADRFVVTARRAALVGAIATALVWGGLFLRDAPADSRASAQLDPAEAALAVWAGEEAPGGD